MSGSLAGIDLGFEDSQAGAGFNLSRPSPIDWDSSTSSGSSVALRRGASSLAVRHLTACTSPDEVLECSYLAAQEALDVLGIQHMHFLGLPIAHYDHLLWWREDASIVVRWCDVSRLNIRVDFSWEKKAADGTVVATSSGTPTPAWHEAMRYIRYSQLRDDLYSAYRDAYLALEAVLSTAAPKAHKEGERKWHVRACRALESAGLDFTSLIAISATDPVDQFVKEQYNAQRCAIFHAKAGNQHFLPGSLADRNLVAVALERLGRFVTTAAKLVLGVDSLVGVMTFTGIKMHADNMSDLQLIVSDDETIAHESQTEANPGGGLVTDLPTQYLGLVDGIGYDFGFLGTIAVGEMASSLVNTTASQADNVVITRGNVEQLVVDGADRFEYYMVLSFSNRAGLKGGFDL